MVQAIIVVVVVVWRVEGLCVRGLIAIPAQISVWWSACESRGRSRARLEHWSTGAHWWWCWSFQKSLATAAKLLLLPTAPPASKGIHPVKRPPRQYRNRAVNGQISMADPDMDNALFARRIKNGEGACDQDQQAVSR
jgi:hypothetical protein